MDLLWNAYVCILWQCVSTARIKRFFEHQPNQYHTQGIPTTQTITVVSRLDIVAYICCDGCWFSFYFVCPSLLLYFYPNDCWATKKCWKNYIVAFFKRQTNRIWEKRNGMRNTQKTVTRIITFQRNYIQLFTSFQAATTTTNVIIIIITIIMMKKKKKKK